jgi:hypothetical protein
LLLLCLPLQVLFNKDSSNVGPKEWLQIAKLLDKNRWVGVPLFAHGPRTYCTQQAVLQGLAGPGSAASLSTVLQGLA